MAQQTITGGDGTSGQTGEQIKNIINQNFTENYASIAALEADVNDLESLFLSSKLYATGDGTTDDATALNTWLNAGSNLYLAEGTYKIGSRLLMSTAKNGLKIICHPLAKIVPVAVFNQANSFLQIANVTNLTIDGLYIEGNGLIASPALDDYDNGMHGIYILDCINVLVQNCLLTKQPKAGILCEGSVNVHLINNNIPATYNYAIWVLSGSDIWIDNNIVSGQGTAQHDATTLGETPGIMVTTADRVWITNNNINDFKNTGTKTEGCSYVTYEGNLVRTSGKDGLKVQTFTPDTMVKHIVVVNNIVEYLQPWASDGAALIMVADAEDFVVSGNIIRGGLRGDADGGQENGIWIIGTGTNRCKRGIVSDNEIYDVCMGGIYAEDVDDILIDNNYINGYGTDLTDINGIWFAGTPTEIKITNNKVLQPSMPVGASSGKGIVVGNSALNIIIKDNEVVNSFESAIAVNAGAADFIEISGNKIKDTGSTAILLQGAGVLKVCKTDNNIISGTIGSGGAAGIMYLRSAAITDASCIGNTINSVGATAIVSFQSAVTKWTEQGNTISGSAVLPTYTTPPTLIQHGLYHFRGTGDPESVVTAGIGAIYLRSDGSTSTTLYIKTSGTGNTGWTAK